MVTLGSDGLNDSGVTDYSGYDTVGTITVGTTIVDDTWVSVVVLGMEPDCSRSETTTVYYEGVTVTVG